MRKWWLLALILGVLGVSCEPIVEVTVNQQMEKQDAGDEDTDDGEEELLLPGK